MIRFASFFASKHKPLIYCVSFANLLIIGYSYAVFAIKISQESLQLESLAHSTTEILAARVSASAATISRLVPEVEKTGGDLKQIQDLINNQITKAGGSLRIAWSDKNHLLRIGTYTMIVGGSDAADSTDNKPINLSHRDYIQYAIRHPHQLYISKILPHIITGRNFFGVAMGTADQQGGYLGCLISIIDVQYLRDILDAAFKKNDVAAHIELPNKEMLYATGDIHALHKSISVQTPEGLSIIVGITQQAHSDNVNPILQTFLLAVLLTNLALFVLYAVYAKYFITPFEKVISYFNSIAPDTHSSTLTLTSPIDRIIAKADNIRNLLADYIATKEQTQHYLHHLQQAVSLLHHMRQEEMLFLHSTSMELEEAFQGLSKYANFVEGKLSDDYAHEDDVFLENVKDITLNLKYLANSFYLICLDKAGRLNLPAEFIDIGSVVDETLSTLGEICDWRNIHINVEKHSPLTLLHYAGLIKHIVWGVIYLAYKFLDDGASLSLRLANTPDSIGINITGSPFPDHLLPNIGKEIVEFIPSKREVIKLAMKDKLQKHINATIITYFIRHFGGAFIIEISDGDRLGFVIRLNLVSLYS